MKGREALYPSWRGSQKVRGRRRGGLGSGLRIGGNWRVMGWEASPVSGAPRGAVAAIDRGGRQGGFQHAPLPGPTPPRA
jgi:hypothetical protein